jgi:hypothetical protein
MDVAHLEKLRRFALTVALALITYVAAGVMIAPNTPIMFLGVPIIINHPALLPIGIAIAAGVTAVRFYYYAIMLSSSPYRTRRDLIDQLIEHHEEHELPGGSARVGIFAPGQRFWMYWGAKEATWKVTRFSLPVWQIEREIVEKRVASFENAFPKFLRARATATLESEPSVDDDGEQYMTYNVKFVIPTLSRRGDL